MDPEDYFQDGTANLFGRDSVAKESPTHASYGPITSRVPPMEGKSMTVLASMIFNSGLVMAEMVELGRIPVSGRRVLELGCSTSVPSLLASTMDPPPASVLTTDYPDATLIRNLEANVRANESVARCPVECLPFLWGSDPTPLLSTLPDPLTGFDLILLADLLWLVDEHDNLVTSISSLLSPGGIAYFTCGDYSKRHVVNTFFGKAARKGFEWEELEVGNKWEGEMRLHVGEGRDKANLGEAKGLVWAFRMWRKAI